MTEITLLLLCAACIVALYFVQDKRARGGLGIAAILLAVAAVFKRDKEEEKPPPAIKPDTKEKEREAIANNIDALDAELEFSAPDTNPDVADLRARLKKRRGDLHDALSDRGDD